MDGARVTGRPWPALLGLLLLAVPPGAASADAGPEGSAANPTPGLHGPVQDPVPELAARIPRLMERLHVPGLVVLVVRRGEVAWSGAFGDADPATARPMTMESIFRVESISKAVTAWGVLRLVERGSLGLDDPVRTHLTRWAPPPGSPVVTVAQLLSNTGGVGLGDYSARFPPDGPLPSLPESLDREFELVAEPGERFLYSDTGFNLLQLLVEEVTGLPFHVWMGMEVLEPLGMEEATFAWTPEVARRLPVGHTLRGEPVEPYVYPGQGSGGLFATAGDLARLAVAGMDRPWSSGRPVLSRASVDLLHTQRVPVGGLYGLVTDGYGLGHFTERLSDGRSAVWHGGQGYGWMTHLHLVPATGDAIVLLANSQRAWPLFAHVLRGWSRSLGVAPVGMARLTLAAPLAWGAVLLMVLGAALVVVRWVGGSAGRSGLPQLRRVRGGRLPRLATGAGLLALVGWCATREYLFLFSVLPATTPWLGAAATLLGVVLLASALSRPSGRAKAGLGAAALLWGAAAPPVAGQQEVASVEAGLFPSSTVSQARSGPFQEASVTAVRASLVVPLAYRSPEAVLAARLTGSYTSIDPRPLDPTQPVWVEALYDLDIQIVAARRIADGWWLNVVAAPGIASDLHNVDAGHLTAQGTALLQRTPQTGPSWGFGVTASNAFGETRVVPLASLDWEAGKATVHLLVPAEASVAVRLRDGVTAGVQATLDGNVYTLGREGLLEEGRVRYSVWEVGPRLEVALGSRLRLTVRGGISLGRRLEVEDRQGIRTEDAGLEHGASVAAGLSFVLPSAER